MPGRPAEYLIDDLMPGLSHIQVQENLSREVGRSRILYSAVQDFGFQRFEETESGPDGCGDVPDSKELFSLDLKLGMLIVKTYFGAISQSVMFGVAFVVLEAEWAALYILGRSGTAAPLQSPKLSFRSVSGWAGRTDSGKLFQGAVTLVKERKREKGR